MLCECLLDHGHRMIFSYISSIFKIDLYIFGDFNNTITDKLHIIFLLNHNRIFKKVFFKSIKSNNVTISFPNGHME